jgi:nucleoside-diphosphate-sugar epimerase
VIFNNYHERTKLKKRIFITGGAGYCGSLLVPTLLELGHQITVYDIMFFTDNYLNKSNKNLKIIKGDIRESKKIEHECKNHDIFINLACVSNDASFELDENLSTSINLHAFEPMVIAAKKSGIKRFIYASSSSVYGISDKINVTEDHELVPLTLYNKYKGMCEPLLLKHADNNFIGVIFRPATVCGYAPRLRLDLSVNILTNHAVLKEKITVFGGDQLRPNLHVRDYCNAVVALINAEDSKIKNEIFNVGYQNLSIKNIALIVKKIVEKNFPDRKQIQIETTKSDDSRSYHINSDKIKKILNFEPKLTIEDAVNDLCKQFKLGKIKNSFESDIFYNVRTIKKINAR